MDTLESTVSSKIKALCAQGYQSYDLQQFDEALRHFYQAWLLLPKPQTQWVEAGWVLTAIGDTYFRLNRLPQACEALKSALCCPSIDENPFVQLRLGQALLDAGELNEARKYLLRCFQKSQQRLFAGESAHYINAIADLIETAPATT